MLGGGIYEMPPMRGGRSRDVIISPWSSSLSGTKTESTARRALTFIVRIFVNDTIAIAVWTCFHCVHLEVDAKLGCDRILGNDSGPSRRPCLP